MVPGVGGVDPLDLFLGVVSGSCVAVYTVFAQRLAADGPRLPLPAAAAASLLVGSVVLVPWMVRDVTGLNSVHAVTLVLWLGVVTTALAYWLFFAGITRLSAATVGTLSLAEPMATTLLGVVSLGERLSPAGVTSCVLLLCGLVIASLPARRGRTGGAELDDVTLVLPQIGSAWSSTAATVRLMAVRHEADAALFPPFRGHLG